MTQEVNNLSHLYEPKSHTKIWLMHGSNSGPRLYNGINKKNICLQNYNFYKFKTQSYKLLQNIFIWNAIIKVVYIQNHIILYEVRYSLTRYKCSQ